MTGYYQPIKRAIEIPLALLAIILVSPLLVLLSIAVKLNSRGPVLYRGKRTGLYGRPFSMLKFRSMVVGAEHLGGSATARQDVRITRVGKILRRYKVDELPQLINVLKGDMSFVGPRPEVQKYTDMYRGEELLLLNMRPGITDWASIWNSEEEVALEGSPDPERTYEELIRPTKIALQLLYYRQRSLTVDARIVFHTAAKLFTKNWQVNELKPYGKVRTYKSTVAAAWQNSNAVAHGFLTQNTPSTGGIRQGQANSL